jgi:hypothetical protein
MIRAFAIRTASVLGVRFFGRVPAVGCMLNCVGAIEPCWTGCTLIGPVGVDLLLGITDNAQHSSSFDDFGPVAGLSSTVEGGNAGGNRRNN